MSTDSVSPLRQRMIEDMSARKLCAGTQRGHIRSCKQFAAFLKRSPDSATATSRTRTAARLPRSSSARHAGARTDRCAALYSTPPASQKNIVSGPDQPQIHLTTRRNHARFIFPRRAPDLIAAIKSP